MSPTRKAPEDWRTPRRWRVGQTLLPLLLLILTPCLSHSQTNTNDAISREVSIFNFGLPSAPVEAISREISVFNLGKPSAPVEAISREVSVYNLGVQYLELTLGSAALRAGDTGGVPVTLFSLAPITNVQLTLDFPAGRLANWAANPSGSLTGSVSGSSSNRVSLTFDPPSGGTFVSTQQLGQITFTAASNQPSAFLPLRIVDATAPLQDGVLTRDKRFHDGEVVVIHKRPLLRAMPGTKGSLGLALYGLPGTNYTIETATNLTPPVTWIPVASTSLTHFIFNLDDLEMTNAAAFYRAQQ